MQAFARLVEAEFGGKNFPAVNVLVRAVGRFGTFAQN
jgi:hypothetical protein